MSNTPGTKHHLLDVLCGFCRCLHEDQAMFLCKLLAFLVAHCTPVRQITFVPNQHYRHVGVGMLPCILQPACEVIESLPPGISPTWISNASISTILEAMSIKGLSKHLWAYWGCYYLVIS